SSFAPLDNSVYYHTMVFLASHRWLWELVISGGVVYTLCLEIGFPFLVWDQRWRWACVCGSVLLHAGIGLFMGLVTFSLIMLVFVCCFIPQEVVKQAIANLTEHAGKLATTPPRPAADAPGELVMTR